MFIPFHTVVQSGSVVDRNLNLETAAHLAGRFNMPGRRRSAQIVTEMVADHESDRLSVISETIMADNAAEHYVYRVNDHTSAYGNFPRQ